MKNWMNTPPFETQYSANTHVDADSCVSESLCHIVYMLSGTRYSPRALAKLSGTTTNGNSISAVLASANQYGLIPYDLWPTPDSFTWDSYYAEIPAEVLAKAEKVSLKLIDPNLDKSPLWTQLSFPGVNGSVLHWVAQINDTQYFDSELGGPIKLLTYHNATVLSRHSLQLTMQDSMKLVNENGTIFLVGELGKLGLADGPSLDLIKQLSTRIENGPIDNLPQIGTLTHNDAFIIHK